MVEIQATQVESTETIVERVLLCSEGGRILAPFWSLLTFHVGCTHRVSPWWKSRLLTWPLLTRVRMKDYSFVVHMCVYLYVMFRLEESSYCVKLSFIISIHLENNSFLSLNLSG